MGTCYASGLSNRSTAHGSTTDPSLRLNLPARASNASVAPMDTHLSPHYPPIALRNGFSPYKPRLDARPQGPQFVRRISELIDPNIVAQTEAVVQSPSGNLLSHADFAGRHDRPLSLRERQEKIRGEMHRKTCRAATRSPDVRKGNNSSADGQDALGVGIDVRPAGGTRWKWSWLCCWTCER